MIKLLIRLVRKFRKIFFYIFYKLQFKELLWNSVIFFPYRINGINNILIGRNVEFQSGLWIYCIKHDNSINATINIDDNCVFGYNNHIVAIGSMYIGKNVLTSNNVYISDNIHDYKDINKPIMHQDIKFTGNVTIGDGTWIGENVSIIGASIGKNCVIGSNAVVTKNIPDYSVAIGVPAKIIKRFNITTHEWESLTN